MMDAVVAVTVPKPVKQGSFARLFVKRFQADSEDLATHRQLSCTGEAQGLGHLMKDDSAADPYVFLDLLRLCTIRKSLADGRHAHKRIVVSGLTHNAFLGTSLMNMYGKCRCLDDARDVFNKMENRSTFTWNTMISAYGHSGHAHQAFKLFLHMSRTSIEPDKMTYVTILRICIHLKDVTQGVLVHAQLIMEEIALTNFLGNAILDMYVKCGRMEDGIHVFDRLATRDVVSWTLMIAGYANYGHTLAALNLFSRLLRVGLMLDDVTFATIFNICASLGNTSLGKQVHAQILEQGMIVNLITGNTLVDMYAKFGSIRDAMKIFETLPSRDVVSWNAMIVGHLNQGDTKQVFNLYNKMQFDNVEVNDVTYINLLNACVCDADRQWGMVAHSNVVESGFERYNRVANVLVSMYAKYGCMIDACKVFEGLDGRDIVTWNIMLAGFVKYRQTKNAIKFFVEMQSEDMKLDGLTFLALLSSNAADQDLEGGRMIHDNIIECGLTTNTSLNNALIHMYCKCGSVHDALNVFNTIHERDVYAWNTLLTAFTSEKLDKEVIHIFLQMQMQGVKPDKVTFLRVLSAFASLRCYESCKLAHTYIIHGGFDDDVFIGSSIIDIYLSAGYLECAQRVFDQLPERNSASWIAMIAGYSKLGRGNDALQLLRKMINEGVKLDEMAFTSAVNACASLAALETGRVINTLVVECGFEKNMVVGNALVDMYAKSGSLKDAHYPRDIMLECDVVPWNALVAGYAQHGCALEAIQLLVLMQKQGIQPNHITFLSILCAFSHAGWLMEGCSFFKFMVQDHEPSLTVEHYVSMLDLLGRAGFLEEANRFIGQMPFQPNVNMWKALLNACRIHRNVLQGNIAAGHVLEVADRAWEDGCFLA